MDSSSAFIAPADFSAEWRDITLINERTHTRVYTASRYGRRFLLKANAPADAELTDFRLQQEREFQLGIQLVHPNIAATYSLEEVDGIGRCIVQEWIDGVTLGEWLQSKPAKTACERVFNQLLDALEYLHGLQLVHHDLKADNILITRNGSNVKLIDFGLSALDSTLSPVSNDPQTDIEALKRLFPTFIPKGQFANIASLRHEVQCRKRIVRMLPIVLSAALLIVAVVFFCLSWQERHAGQQRYEAMVEMVDKYMVVERAQLEAIVNRAETYNAKSADEYAAYHACWEDINIMREQQWAIRDSIAALYPDDDPLQEQFIQLWNRKEGVMNNELYPVLTGKLKP